MNAHIDSLQTWSDLGSAASPEVRRAVVLVNAVKIDIGATNGARTAPQTDTTDCFVWAKRSFLFAVASTDRLAALQLANLTVLEPFWSTFLRWHAEQKQRFRSRLSHFLIAPSLGRSL